VTPRERTQPLLLPQIAIFTGAVFLLLIYSRGWEFPIFGENAGVAQGGLMRAAVLPAYAVGFALIAISPFTTLRVGKRQPFLILLMAIVCGSVLWSVNPDITVRRSFAVTCTTLGGVALAAHFKWRQLAEMVATTFAILIVLSLVLCIAVPSIGVMTELFPGAWRGLWAEKNALGGNMALAFYILGGTALLNPRRAKLWWAFAGLALLLVLMSTSKTSLASLLVGGAALAFVVIAQISPAAGAAVSWAGITGVMLLVGFLLVAADVFFAILGKDATLTGRTKIWDAVIHRIEERPWLGYGYSAVWDDKSPRGPFIWIVKEAGFKPQHSHNSWLEQWLAMGIPGLIAWGLFYLQTMALAIVAVFRHPGALLVFPFLVVYTLVSLTESIAVVYNDFRWALFVAFAAKLAFSDRELDRG
jgi:O-antigen ligase